MNDVVSLKFNGYGANIFWNSSYGSTNAVFEAEADYGTRFLSPGGAFMIGIMADHVVSIEDPTVGVPGRGVANIVLKDDKLTTNLFIDGVIVEDHNVVFRYKDITFYIACVSNTLFLRAVA